jgi:threonyl-tRNA synthetase
MNAKIRNAQNEKIPYMLIVGEKERSAGTVSLRTRSGEQAAGLALAKLKAMLHDKVRTKEPL